MTGSEWKEAGKLEAGDKLLAPDGQWQPIVKVTRQTRNEQVYNFQVEGNHNYFVGAIGTLVHNACWNPNPKKGLSAVENALEHWNKHGGDFPNL